MVVLTTQRYICQEVHALQVKASVAYPGLVNGGCSVRTRNFAHAQIVGRCGFEREYGRNTVCVKKFFNPKTFAIVL